MAIVAVEAECVDTVQRLPTVGLLKTLDLKHHHQDQDPTDPCQSMV